MKYKLVLSDFDGTLLKSDDTVSPRTITAIRAYVAAGGVFGISTGRAFASIRKRLGELGLCGNFPVMSCQGALSCDSRSGEVLASIPMPANAAVTFLRRAMRLDLPCQFYTDDAIYASEFGERNREYFKRNRLVPVVVDDVCAFAQTCGKPILKVLCMLQPCDRERVLQAVGNIEGATVCSSHAMLIEAMSCEAGKGNGLRRTCERLGIDLANSVAIGDESNDTDMIRAAGLGVAMGNALPTVKKAADYVTADCDDDGVAEVLEKICAGAFDGE